MKKLNYTPQPCCSGYCRTWDETAGGLPPSDHAPGCTNYIIKRFKKVISPGHWSFIDTEENHDFFMDGIDDIDNHDLFLFKTVYMTQDQFDKLPEFNGF